MEYEFYLDLFFLINFFLNFLSLFLSASMGRMNTSVVRLLAASAAGSVWSVLLFLFPVRPAFLALFLTVFLAGSVMVSIAFSLKSPLKTGKAVGMLTLSAALCSGFFTFLKQTFWLTDWECICALACLSLGAGLFFKNTLKEKERGRERFVVWLYYRGKKKQFLALADSGNRLREPGSKKPVSVISYGDCVGFCDVISSVLYIPYRAVGTKEGVLPGILFDRMEIETEYGLSEVKRPIVAVTKEPLSGSGDFSMLIPEIFVLSGKK